MGPKFSLCDGLGWVGLDKLDRRTTLPKMDSKWCSPVVKPTGPWEPVITGGIDWILVYFHSDEQLPLIGHRCVVAVVTLRQNHCTFWINRILVRLVHVGLKFTRIQHQHSQRCVFLLRRANFGGEMCRPCTWIEKLQNRPAINCNTGVPASNDKCFKFSEM